MSIENPTTADRNIWRCFMGFTELDVEFSAGAILDASDTAFNINSNSSITILIRYQMY